MEELIWPLVVGAVGLALSAFFSGSETGLYRVSRVRLRLEAAQGDWIARILLWLVNRPGLFVATALVGNNLANNMVSLAVVLFSQLLFSRPEHLSELLLTLVLSPGIFVYGELLPKYLFLQAPNRLLRQTGPVFFFFTVIFLPVSLLVWGINFLLNQLLGGSVQPVRFQLARRELRRILEDAYEVGVLQPVQRRLAEALFRLANQPIGQFALPLESFPRVRGNIDKKTFLRQASKYRWSEVLVEASEALPAPQGSAPSQAHPSPPLYVNLSAQFMGYIRPWELLVQKGENLAPIHPLTAISAQEKFLPALVQMERQKTSLAALVDPQGNLVGLVSLARLRERLLAA